MIGGLKLLLCFMVSRFRSETRLEAEIVVLRHQLKDAVSAAINAPRSIDLRLALSMPAGRAERRYDRQARNGRTMAPRRIPFVLALEVSRTRRPTTNLKRATPSHS